jgi:hypothetical protein
MGELIGAGRGDVDPPADRSAAVMARASRETGGDVAATIDAVQEWFEGRE